jgi:hypothetical protein
MLWSSECTRWGLIPFGSCSLFTLFFHGRELENVRIKLYYCIKFFHSLRSGTVYRPDTYSLLYMLGGGLASSLLVFTPSFACNSYMSFHSTRIPHRAFPLTFLLLCWHVVYGFFNFCFPRTFSRQKEGIYFRHAKVLNFCRDLAQLEHGY